MSPPWASAVQVLLVQGVIGVATGWLLWVSGAGGAVFVVVPLLAGVLGAWAWAVRAGRGDRARVRAVAARQGALVGPLVGVAWAAVAAQPGQVDVPQGGVVLVALLLSLGAGATSAGLTLCGLDLGRAAG